MRREGHIREVPGTGAGGSRHGGDDAEGRYRPNGRAWREPGIRIPELGDGAGGTRPGSAAGFCG